jgi:hypothetical protein
VDLNEDLGLASAIRVDRIDLEQGILRAAGEVVIPKRPGPAARL